jgi:hypothetical protein
MILRVQPSVSRSTESSRRISDRQVEFPSTVEADLVGAAFDGEHAAEMSVPAAEYEVENRR